MVLLLAVLLTLRLVQAVFGVRVEEFVEAQEGRPQNGRVERSGGAAGRLQHGHHMFGPKLPIGHVNLGHVREQALRIDFVEDLSRLQVA